MALLNIFPTMRGWFSGLTKVAFRSEEAVSLWALAIIGGFRTGSFTRVMKRIAFATFTCLLALGTFPFATLFYYSACLMDFWLCAKSLTQ